MKFLISGLISLVILLLGVALYEQYGDSIRTRFFGQGDTYTIYVNRVAFSVAVADSLEERRQGLSGVPSLDAYEGKLFIFDGPGKHGIWMKDMNFPLDILWFNERFELIHVEENVTPDTYPAVFAPPSDARFVLEINAFATKTYAIPLGSTLVLPTAIIPGDLKDSFQVN